MLSSSPGSAGFAASTMAQLWPTAAARDGTVNLAVLAILAQQPMDAAELHALPAESLSAVMLVLAISVHAAESAARKAVAQLGGPAWRDRELL